jgi:hypothetical protein
MPPDMFGVITFAAKMVINVTRLLKPSRRRPNARRVFHITSLLETQNGTAF